MKQFSIEDISSKEITIKVYAVLLTYNDGDMDKKTLWSGLAYTLEEALYLARRETMGIFPEDDTVPYWSPELYMATPLTEFVSLGLKTMRPIPDSDKNSIMKKIVDNSDIGLMKKHAKDFSKAEMKLLKDLLSKKAGD